jgi:hypothetical protein
MPKSIPKQNGVVRKAVPNDALFRLGKKIEAELQIPPVPDHVDPVTGRRDPAGFFAFNHYTGRTLRRK